MLFKNLKKQICKHGHDTFVCGRNKWRECNECKKSKNRIDPNKDSRSRPICINGHDISVVGRDEWGNCNTCVIIRKNIWDENNRHKISEDNKKWKEAHPDYFKQWRAKHRPESNEKHKEWIKKHPEVLRIARMKCKTNRNIRIVAWTDWKSILEFEKKKPTGMTTDHIIPLQNELVWGLHVSWNMQYLTKSENSKKHNKVNLIEVSEWYGKILEKEGLK